MARQRVIVGIGEALLVERGKELDVGGLAVDVALEGCRIGQRGVVISRLGQDHLADELRHLLQRRDADLSYLQSDPDHTTGRLLIRTMFGKSNVQLDDEAAFDFLQWDFDLHDIAQVTDLVVFGALSRRSGLTRSTTERFLGECTGAMRLFDLTNRGAKPLSELNVAAGMRYANATAVDEQALRDAWPSGRSKPISDAARAMLRHFDLDAALLFGDGEQPPSLVTADSQHTHATPWPNDMRTTGMIAAFTAMLDGLTPPEAFDVAQRVIEHRRQSETDPIPAELWQRPA